MNEVPNAGVTRTLARYVADAQPADIPDAVTHEARRASRVTASGMSAGCASTT